MKDWIIKNWWSLLIALLTISTTYSMYGYRIAELEKRDAAQQIQIVALQESNSATAVNLAKIQKDIEYIRFQIDRVFPKVN